MCLPRTAPLKRSHKRLHRNSQCETLSRERPEKYKDKLCWKKWKIDDDGDDAIATSIVTFFHSFPYQ